MTTKHVFLLLLFHFFSIRPSATRIDARPRLDINSWINRLQLSYSPVCFSLYIDKSSHVSDISPFLSYNATNIAKKEQQRLHRQKRRSRRSARTNDALELTLNELRCIQNPLNPNLQCTGTKIGLNDIDEAIWWTGLYKQWKVTSSDTLPIDWSAIPPSIDPLTNTAPRLGLGRPGAEERGLRKRRQVESLYKILIKLGQAYNVPGTRIVEFGCGTGHLLLVLAHLMPHAQFVGVDLNGESLRLMEQHARAAGS